MFKNKLIELDYIDDSGSDSYSRFDYQLACAFETLLTLYKTNEDFFVLLDYLDDYVIVENSGKEDESITFIQVKTKNSGPFTINFVAKQEWIKKQVKNYKEFLDSNVKNILKTNFGIKIKDELIDSTNFIPLSDYIDNEDASALINQITTELSGKGKLEDFGLICATLSLKNLENQIIGQLHDYASNNNYKNLTVEAIKMIYLQLWKELSIKQKYVPTKDEKKSFDIIIEKKGIKYSRILEVFNVAKEIDIPEKSVIYSFCQNKDFDLEDLTLPAFLIGYENFKRDSVLYGMDILKECSNLIVKEKLQFTKCSDIKSGLMLMKDLLANDIIIGSSEYFKNYKVYIAVLLCYKLFEGD